MRLVHSIPGFSLRKIVTGYEILDSKSETGSRQIGPQELAAGDIVIAATLNTQCLAHLFKAFGEKAIMLETGDEDKAVAAPFDPNSLSAADLIALLAQEPVQRYAAHPRQ